MNRYGLWAVVGVALVIGGADAEQVYRWKDKSGRLHFSNVGPGEGATASEASSPPLESGRGGDEDRPKAEAGKEKRKSAHADLSPESFSSVASRRRAELRRELDGAKREIREIDAELASLAAIREQTFEQYAQPLQGVTRPEAHPSEQEEALLERKKALEKRIADIRAGYDELRQEAAERSGGVPAWWLPLD